MLTVSMYRRVQLLLTLFLMLIHISCKKEGTISGKVTTMLDNQPVKGVRFKITYSSGGYLNYKSGDLPSVETDQNGEFSANEIYKSRKKYKYQIVMSPPQTDFSGPAEDTMSAIVETYFYSSSYYSEIDQSQMVQHITKSPSQHFEFKVVATARLKIVATDVPPFGESLSEVKIDDPKLMYPDYYYVYLKTQYSEGIYKYVVPRNGEVKVKWTSYLNGVGTEYTQNVALQPFSKGIFHLDY